MVPKAGGGHTKGQLRGGGWLQVLKAWGRNGRTCGCADAWNAYGQLSCRIRLAYSVYRDWGRLVFDRDAYGEYFPMAPGCLSGSRTPMPRRSCFSVAPRSGIILGVAFGIVNGFKLFEYLLIILFSLN